MSDFNLEVKETYRVYEPSVVAGANRDRRRKDNCSSRILDFERTKHNTRTRDASKPDYWSATMWI